MSFALFIVLLLFSPLSASALPATQNDGDVPSNKVVVIMIDGFRYDYATRDAENTPTFGKLAAEGAKADYVQTIFPSVSMPGWTTIATGLFAEEHGMVGNYMFDPETEKLFSFYPDEEGNPQNSDPFWFDQHIPLWLTAQHQERRVSVRYWSSCDVPAEIDDIPVLPEFCEPYRANIDKIIDIERFSEVLDEVVDDLVLGRDVVFAYTEAIDALGHVYGPDSQEVIEAVRTADSSLGDFMDKLEAEGILNSTDIIIVSDHGMTAYGGKDGRVITDAMSNPTGLEVAVEDKAYMYLKVANPEEIDTVVDELKALEGVSAWANEDIPQYLRFKNDRTLDILVHSDGTAMIYGDPAYEGVFIPEPEGFPPGTYSFAGHGFDDTSPDAGMYQEGNYDEMRTIFYAMGPSFKSGRSHQWIKLVDEYQILAHAMGVTPEKHSGSWGRVSAMLKARAAATSSTSMFLLSATIALGRFLL